MLAGHKTATLWDLIEENLKMTYLENKNKWQAMLAIVSNDRDYSPHQIEWEWKKLFIKRLIAENCLIFLLQYAGLMFNTLTLTHFPIWFASGTACGFIFLRGYRILPSIWLGSFFAYYFSGLSAEKACFCALIISLQPAILLYLSRRYIGLTLIFNRIRSLIKFFLLSIVVTAFTNFLLQLIYTSIWLSDWLANLNGVLIVSFAIISLDTYFPQYAEGSSLNKKKLVGFFILLFGMLLIFLLGHTPITMILGALLISIFIVKINIFYGWCGVMATLFSCGFFINLCTGISSHLTYHTFLTEIIITWMAIFGLVVATDRGIRG